MSALCPVDEQAPLMRYRWWMLSALVPMAAYFILLCIRVTDTPYQDDFLDILQPAVMMHESDSWLTFLKAAFWQYHQHMVVYDRLVYLLVSIFTDAIDFRILTVIGNLGLLIYAIALMSRIDKTQAFLLPCIAAIIFSLYHEEQTFWAMAAVQQFTIMAFTIFSFMLLNTRKKNIALAGFFAGLALFTQSNEALILPLGFCILLDDFFRDKGKQQRVNLVLWAGCCLLILVPFLLLNNTGDGMILPPDTVVLQGYAAWLAIVEGFFASLVSLPFTIQDPVVLPAVVGAGHGLLILYLMIKGWRHDRVVVCLMLFCLLSLLAASIMRTPYYGSSAYVARYKIFCSSIICGEMILASKVFGGRIRLMPCCLVLALVICGHSYYKNMGYIKHTENFRNRKAVEWLYKGVMESMPFSASILAAAYDAGIYSPVTNAAGPVMPLDIHEIAVCPDITAWPSTPFVVQQGAAQTRGIMLLLRGAWVTESQPDQVWLCGKKSFHISLRNLADYPQIQASRWLVLLEKKQFPVDSYRVALTKNGKGFVVDGNVDTHLQVNKEIEHCRAYKSVLASRLPELYGRYCD